MSSPISGVARGDQAPCRSSRSSETACSILAASAARPRCSHSIAADRIAAVGSAFCLPAMSGALPCTGSNMLGAVRSGLMLALAARPMPPATAAPSDGQDVAEHVVGDDDVEPLRLGEQVDRGRVHVAVLGGHLGEVGRGRGDGPPPQVAGVGEHVALVHEGQLAARPLGRPLQRVPGHPADAERGVDALLSGDLGRSAACA